MSLVIQQQNSLQKCVLLIKKFSQFTQHKHTIPHSKEGNISVTNNMQERKNLLCNTDTVISPRYEKQVNC